MEEKHVESRLGVQKQDNELINETAHRSAVVAVGAEAAIDEVLDSREQHMVENLRVTRLVGGLNFGKGTISKNDRLDAKDDDLDHSIVTDVEAAIQAPQILTRVEADDDGCGDGRGVKLIQRGKEVLKHSLHRAKVFGGGLTMSVAARIGLAETNDQPLEAVFEETMDILDGKKLPYGAHTDEHAHGDNCGCGAIDKAPAILENTIVYKEQIASAIDLLTNGQETDVLDEVFSGFTNYAKQIEGQPYKGSRIISKIRGTDKVVKELEGPHLETHIVINTVRGMTVNQEYIRKISDGKAQVFGVDAWRKQDIAKKLYPKDSKKQERAYLSMLVYTLATAGTLTKGDLPVYVVE